MHLSLYVTVGLLYVEISFFPLEAKYLTHFAFES